MKTKGLLGWLLFFSLIAMGAGIGDNFLRIGQKTGADIEMALGSGRIKWNDTDSKLRFSNDAGTIFKDIGAGGAGGGENFNNGFTSDDNPNAENGLDGWTNSGGGNFALDTADPLEGEQSFKFTASAQNDYVESALLDFDRDIFKGKDCQASIQYIGGDENLTLKVINGNATEVASEVLPAHPYSDLETVYFRCPTDSEIVGDANLGDLKFRIENVGASAAPLIKWDRSYIGTNFALVETRLPDKLSARFEQSGAVIVSQNTDWIDSFSSIAGGRATVTFKAGVFTETPACQITQEDISSSTDETCGLSSVNPIDTTDVEVRCYDGTGALANGDFSLSCEKQGVDAKQSVQVLKTIPKVSDNVNTFSAKGDFEGVVSNENTNWIDGNCTESPAGRFTCDFVSGVFSTAPNCIGDKDGSSSTRTCEAVSSSSTQVVIECYNTTLASESLEGDTPWDVVCQRGEGDFKFLSENLVLVNQVQSSFERGVVVESCRVNNAGTAVTDSDLCDSWIVSATRTGAGLSTITYDTDIFAERPNCTVDAVMGDGIRGSTAGYNPGSNEINVVTEQPDTLTNVDADYTINCVGER